jgi:hypothetical protein
MMNPIGVRNEDQIRSRGRMTATAASEQGGAGPVGTRVRRSGWARWRSATGRSCGPRARAGSGWTSPSATTGTTASAIYAAAPGSSSDPSPAPGSGEPGAGQRPCRSARSLPSANARQPAAGGRHDRHHAGYRGRGRGRAGGRWVGLAHGAAAAGGQGTGDHRPEPDRRAAVRHGRWDRPVDPAPRRGPRQPRAAGPARRAGLAQRGLHPAPAALGTAFHRGSVGPPRGRARPWAATARPTAGR